MMPRLISRWFAAALVVIVLTGCQRELVTALPEGDGNEVLAVLLSAGIEAEKSTADGGKTWTVNVPEQSIVRALSLLREQGLPRNRYANLGEMFKKDGLISTPVEERVRFVYGVSQELADTLSRMDGVVTARVHIVLPSNDPLASDVKPASASVFVKHRPDVAMGTLAAPIKNLVAHSVEGLAYDEVHVTFMPAGLIPVPPSQSARSSISWLPFAAAGGVALVLAAGVAGWFVWVRRRQRRGPVSGPGNRSLEPMLADFRSQ